MGTRSRWSAIVLVVGILATACVPDPPPPAVDFTWAIDPSIAPPVTSRPDERGGTMEFSASQDDEGVSSTFVANQVVVRPENRAQLDSFVARHDGQIIDDDAVPEPPPEYGITVDPADTVPTAYTVRLDPSTFPLDDFERDAEALGLDNAATYSSDQGARLMALARSEQVDGVDVRPDHLSSPQYLERTDEATLAAGPSNAFTYAEAANTGARSRVASAWQWIDAFPSLTPIQIAIIDGGFRLDEVGNPISTPLGTNYAPGRPIQWDFVGGDVHAGGPNPGRCGMVVCDWHGDASAGAAAGVLDDGAGAAGSGGQVADPMLLKFDGTSSQSNAAVRTAVAWGADVISMSYGTPCDHDCRNYSVGFEFDSARAAGVVLVAAAGNTDQDVLSPNYVHPCIQDDVICVGALASAANVAMNSDDAVDDLTDRATYSNFGNGVDLFAPSDVAVAPTDDERTDDPSRCGPGSPTVLNCLHIATGTSASAPYVAGVVAMMRAANYALSPQQVRDRLVGASWHDSNDPSVAPIGHLDALGAVRAATAGVLPDPFEPDNDPMTAPLRGLGTYRDFRLSTGSDVDHVVVQSNGVIGFWLQQRYPTEIGRPSLGFVRADDSECGDVLLETSTTAAGQNNAAYRVAAGRFAVRTGNPGGTATPYEVAVVHQSADITADPFETINGETDNDVQQTATSINTGRGERQATIHPGDPTDWYHFTSPGGLFDPKVGGSKFSFAITSTDIPVEVQLHSTAGPFGPPLRTDEGCRGLPSVDLPAGEFWAQVTPLTAGARGNYSFKASSRTVDGRLYDLDAFWAELLDPSIPITYGLRDRTTRVGLLPTPAAAAGDELRVNVLAGVTTRLLDGDGNVVATEQRDAGAPNVARLLADLRADEAYALELTQSSALYLPDVTVPATIMSVEAPPPPPRVQVSADSEHSCAVRPDSTVACWGYNGQGRLGNATSTYSSVPVVVDGLTGATQVSTGLSHSCALRQDGTVACWGANGQGQLGNGTVTHSSTPVEVSGLSDAVSISGGAQHQCAVRSGGQAVCWGFNGYGQLGDETNVRRLAPVAVSGLTGVTEISAGGNTTCATTADTEVWCWGDNNDGQVGDGTTDARFSPTAVPEVQAVDVATSGTHTCAVTDAGAVLCWGRNANGQLGNGGTAPSTSPVAVVGLGSIATVTTGESHTCAIAGSGAVACWGANSFGQLGNGSFSSSSVPVSVPSLSARQADAGQFHTCFVRADERAVCAGWGASGQLGHASFGTSPVPVEVSGL